MQQQEAFAARGRAVAAIQPRDAEHRDVEQRVVGGGVLGVGIRPVRQQREVQLVVRRGEVVDLEPVQMFFHRGARAQHHGHRDQGAQFLRNAVAQRQAGQAAGADAARDGAVDQRDRDIDGGNGAEQRLTTTACRRCMPASCSIDSGTDRMSAEVTAIAAT